MIDVLDLSFLDRDHGFALVAIRGGESPGLAVRRTRDGGRTWSADRAVWDPGVVHHVRFTTTTLGWAFGPGLFVTRDGGRSWKRQHPGETVVSVAVSGPSVWALLADCTQSRCHRVSLRISTDAGAAWHGARLPSGLSGPDLQMERRGSTGWILSSGDTTSKQSRLVVTHDGGSSWSALDNPCLARVDQAGTTIGPFVFEEHLSAVDPSTLWLMCLVEPAGGSTFGRLFVSSDGGGRWLPGWIGASGYDLDVAAVSLTSGWIVDNAAAQALYLLRTTGRSGRQRIRFGNPPMVGLQFVDPDHGWAAAGGTVYRTTDGRTWHTVHLRP